jgi:class 3 adenylate cyclase
MTAEVRIQMELKRACLVIADISGYTRFLLFHTTSLLHAEAIITDLLEAVIAEADYPLTISKLEGDAVFLYAIIDTDPQAALRDILTQVMGFFAAFRMRERALIACNTCGCPACRRIDKLHLKIAIHYGEVAIKQIRQFVELAGESVIVIHRLLKNSIPAKEYIVLTDAVYELSHGLPGMNVESRTEHAEGIGAVGVKVYYPPAAMPLPPQPPPSLSPPGSEGALLYERLHTYAYRRLGGLEAHRTFSSLPNTPLTGLRRFGYIVGRIIPQCIDTLQRLLAKNRASR